MEAARYPFGADFQRRAAASIVQDASVLARCRDAVRPSFFEDRFLSCVIGEVLAHHDQFRGLPGYAVLDQRAFDRARTSGMDERETGIVREYVARLGTYPIGDLDYIVDKLASFGRGQAVKEAILAGIDLVHEHPEDPEMPTKVARLVNDASLTGLSSDLGVDAYDFFPDLSSLWSTDPTSDPSRKVKTFLPSLTQRMRGGPGAGELVVVIGATKAGKSKVLQRQAAIGAILSGKVPWIVTAELKVPDWTAEVLSALTGIPTDVLRDHPHDERVRRATWELHQRNVHFRLKYFPPESATTGHIRSWVQRTAMTTGTTPDLLVVDYLDELRPERPFGRGGSSEAETYMTFGRITSDLIQIGYDMRVPVWTAAQMKRSGYQDEEPGMDSVGESLKKVSKADWVIVLARTKEMRKHDRMDVILAGGRRGPDGVVIPCTTDFSKCLIRELDVVVPPAPMPQPVGANGHGQFQAPSPWTTAGGRA